MPEVAITYKLNPSLTNDALNALYVPSWPKHTWFDFMPVLQQALANIAAYEGETLTGFVYVAWDGAQHAFLLEPTVHPDLRHNGIGTELVRRAAEAARDAGCQWLHVDYEPHLAPFYEVCGFVHTEAGLIRLDARVRAGMTNACIGPSVGSGRVPRLATKEGRCLAPFESWGPE